MHGSRTVQLYEDNVPVEVDGRLAKRVHRIALLHAVLGLEEQIMIRSLQHPTGDQYTTNSEKALLMEH
jgi:hypothetical protein